MSVYVYPFWTYADMRGADGSDYAIDVSVTEDPGGAPSAWTLQFGDDTEPNLFLNHVDTDPITTPYGQSEGWGVEAWGTLFAAQLTSESATSGKTWTYTMVWDEATGAYTLDTVGGDFDLTWNQTRDKACGGFSADLSGGGPYVSDITPWYHIRPVAEDIMSDEDEERETAIALAWTPRMHSRGYKVGDVPKFTGMEFQHEPPEAVFKRDANSFAPFTWEHCWEHCRTEAPLYITDSMDDRVYRLDRESILFDRKARRRTLPRNDGWWTIRMDLVILGST